MTEHAAARPQALITGASAGIGAAFARRLAQQGYDLVLVARRRAPLEALAHDVQHAHGVAVQVLPADLTQPADLHTVEQHVADDPALELLINNAGFPGYRPFIDLAPEQAEALISLHVLATTRLTRAALPGMVARERGSIINVASMLAFSASIPATAPLPQRAVYAACKAYLVTFTALLAHQVEGTPVRVQALCPGLVRDTEFHADVPGFDPARLGQAGVGPEEVVTAALRGLELGEVICAPGLDDPSLIEEVRAGERAVPWRRATPPSGLASTMRGRVVAATGMRAARAVHQHSLGHEVSRSAQDTLIVTLCKPSPGSTSKSPRASRSTVGNRGLAYGHPVH